MFGFLRKRHAQPQERYEVKAVLRTDRSEIDAALAKAEELETTIKRARTLAGELARMTRSLRLNVEVDTCPAEGTDIVTGFDGHDIAKRSVELTEEIIRNRGARAKEPLSLQDL